MSKDLICVLGPTASGKTKYAVKLAHEIDGEIISADSRQVYKYMDIGTGKDLDEYNFKGVDIPYHLIDIVQPGTKYNIFEYQRDFHKVLLEIQGRGKQPILCGGSGLYIEAATQGYSLPQVAPNIALRAELEQLSDQELISRLESLKPLHNTSDTDSRKRVIRALEITISGDFNIQKYPLVPTCFIGILVTRQERIKRIDKRLKERLEGGMIEEVQSLLDRGILAEDLIYYGLEYKFVTLYITGKLSYSEMHKSLETAIHQFAKRQMTWFRRMERKGIKIEWKEPV
ncbi:MAG: tRNA (adenosine(37)-N6)-dimethylallyltransferase MiaA [Bacteroidales bacterium]